MSTKIKSYIIKICMSKIGFKIFSYVYLLFAKVILRVRAKLFWLFYMQVSNELIFKLRDKKIQFVNNLAHVITNRLLSEGVKETDSPFYEEQRALTDTESAIILSAAEYKKMIADYHLLTAYYYSFGFASEEYKQKIEAEVAKAKEYNENAIPITTETFNETRFKISKQYDISKKKYVLQRKEVLNEDYYKAIPKLKITLGQIASLVGVVSTVFLLTGFIYNKYFLGFYNIEVSKFFTMSDYIATSVEKIFISALSAVVGVFFYISGMLSAIRRGIVEWHFEEKKNRFDNIVYTSMFGFVALTVYSWYKDLPGKHYMLSLSIFIILMLLFQSIPLKKYLKKSVYISTSVIFYVLLTFSLSVYDKVMEEREKILHADIKTIKKYHFTFDGDVGFDENSTVLLSRNSEYFFFYNKETGKTYILPKSRVNSIEVTE